MAWAAAAGGAAGAAGSMLGAGPTYGFNAMGASLAFDRQKKMIKRGPTWAVKGLKRAGLNPILAASGGLRIGGAATAQMAHAAKSDNAGLAFMQGRSLVAQTSAADAAARKANAEAAITEAGIPRADYLRTLYSTPAGRELLLTGEQNAALPNTAAGIASRIGYSGTRGRSAEFDAAMGAITNAPGRLFRKYQQRKRQSRTNSWQMNQTRKAR